MTRIARTACIGIRLSIKGFGLMIRKGFLGTLLLGCAGTCLAAWMPHDTQWILDVDMQALSASRVGAMVVARMQHERPVVFEKVCNLTAVTGINLNHALTTLTVCGSGWNASNVVSHIVGRSAFSQVCRDHLGASFAVSAYGPYELFAWTKGPLCMAVSQPEAGRLIVAEPLRLKNALDVYAGRGRACDVSRFHLFATPQGQAIVRFEAHDVAAILQQDQSPYGLVLRQFNTLDGRVSEAEDQIHLTVRGFAPTAEAAQQAAQLVQTLVALSQMGSKASSELRSVLREIQVEQDGTQVRCHVVLTFDQAKALCTDGRSATTHAAHRQE